MDEMDMESMDILTGSNPTIQPDCNMLGKGVLPGLRYRHLGKSGLKVTNGHVFHFYTKSRKFEQQNFVHNACILWVNLTRSSPFCIH